MNVFSKVFNKKNPPREDLPPIVKVGHSDPYYQEQFKALRAKIESRVETDGIKVVAITSAIASEGKTISSVNLALNIASTGRKKVLLVDTDFRKCDLSYGLELSQVPGLGEYLADTASINDILRRGYSPGLDIIPAGKTLSDPSTLLGGERFRSFLGKIRDHFDIIILDCPPILPVADTLALRDLVDGFILLFRIQATPYLMLKQALEELGNSITLLGVVLNGLEPHRHKYYQRYYGKYYHRIVEEDTPS